MAWTTPPVFVAGDVPTAANFNIISDDLAHLGGMKIGNTALSAITAGTILAGLGFSVYDTTNQTGITNAKLTFTIERFDTNSAYNTSTSRFTAPVAGFYQIGANIRSSAGQTLELQKNGSPVFQYGASGDNWTNGSFVTVLSLAASDYIELWHTSTGTATVTKTAVLSEFWGVKVG